jgi:hypothetical protein
VVEHFQLNIAGIGIELVSDFPMAVEPAADKFYAPFRASGTADVSLTVTCGKLPRTRRDKALFDAQTGRWRLFRPDGHYMFEVFDTRPPHAKVQVATVGPAWDEGEVRVLPAADLKVGATATGSAGLQASLAASAARRPESAWSLVRLMQPLGELLLINRLSRGHGVLLHGLAVIDQGRGLVFVGRSGAGKSTLAKLYAETAPDVTILNDEHIAVTRQDGRFWVSGTPWPGAHFTFSPQSAPLHRVYVLEHAKANRVLAERPSTFCARLVQQMFVPFWSHDGLAFALRFAEELVAAVSAFRLGFVNDSRVISFLRQEG